MGQAELFPSQSEQPSGPPSSLPSIDERLENIRPHVEDAEQRVTQLRAQLAQTQGSNEAAVRYVKQQLDEAHRRLGDWQQQVDQLRAQL